MKILCGIALLSLLSAPLLPQAGYAADLRDMANKAENIASALRSADDARYSLERAAKGTSDYSRLEQSWKEREYALEEARLREMARETRRSEDELRALRRNGRGWDDICRDYRCRSERFGFDRRYKQFDRDGDFWHDYYEHPGKGKGHYKGTEDGPPGQYKDKGKGKGKHKDKD